MPTTWGTDWDYSSAADRCHHILYLCPYWLQEALIVIVLKYLHKASLYTKAEKYEFHIKLVLYLGYILSPFSLIIFNDKMKIIQDWLKPKKVKDIQFFLDFSNFYYWFIFNYLDIVILLTCLT